MQSLRKNRLERNSSEEWTKCERCMESRSHRARKKLHPELQEADRSKGSRRNPLHRSSINRRLKKKSLRRGRILLQIYLKLKRRQKI